MNINKIQQMTRWLLGIFFIYVGSLHFTDPAPFLHIMPPYMPWHLPLIWLSGFFEILGGIGLLWKPLRRRAGWGLIALLIAVYPANIHMLLNEIYLPGMDGEPWMLWVRMPIQFILAMAVSWTAGIWPQTQTE